MTGGLVWSRRGRTNPIAPSSILADGLKLIFFVRALDAESQQRTARAEFDQIVVRQLADHHAAAVYYGSVGRTQIAQHILIAALDDLGVM